MMADLVFFAAVSTLLLHEMDAIDKKEWRWLFVLRRLPDSGALRWFILLHIPVFIGLLVLVGAESNSFVRGIQGVVDGFMIVHAGLHERLAVGGERAFANAFSRSLIWASAGFGAVHLMMLLADRG